jgi:hypothetical protein
MALLGDEALAGWWYYSAEASEIGSLGLDPDSDELALSDD